MFVINSKGLREPVHFDKITQRLEKLCDGLHESVDPVLVAQKTIQGLYKGITTAELDGLASETAANLTAEHPDYSVLAARICLSRLYRNIPSRFSDAMFALYNAEDSTTGRAVSMISQRVYDFVMENKDRLDAETTLSRNDSFDYFAYRTTEAMNLMKLNGRLIEHPQYMYMRVACGIWAPDLDMVVKTYHYLSRQLYTHATPTMRSAGMNNAQGASCFLFSLPEDSITGMYRTILDFAHISKYAGGIGAAISMLRSKGAYIRGNGGVSSGIIPYLRVVNNEARHVNQGGVRPGAFAMYLEPWHPDIEDFVQLKRTARLAEEQCLDLFLALWVPDLFMDRVIDDANWSLFDPDQCPGLAYVYGNDFNALYKKYESEGKAKRAVKARELFKLICDMQVETSLPYIMFKDAVNRKNAQQNVGTIMCSNLCSEIVEFTGSPIQHAYIRDWVQQRLITSEKDMVHYDPPMHPDDEHAAVCMLSSIVLSKFVTDAESNGFKYDFAGLASIVKHIVQTLDHMIDTNYYPIPQTRHSNQVMRPLGIGVQGFQDTLWSLKIPFVDPQNPTRVHPDAKKLNIAIFETIYYAAISASMELSKLKGSYLRFQGSPASEGLLQFDLWAREGRVVEFSGMYDWNSLKEQVKQHGLRNSLLVALMPTATTSQICSQYESFEPAGSNLFLRQTKAGGFQIVNKYLVSDLIRFGLWTPEMRELLLAKEGSVQGVGLPKEMENLYKTVWEIPQMVLMDLMRDRAPFIDQACSQNVYFEKATYEKLSALHTRNYKAGLKNSSYYLRTRTDAKQIKFAVKAQMNGRQTFGSTLPADKVVADTKPTKPEEPQELMICNRNDPTCLACSS